MTDEELIARLRKYKDDLLSITADRIEALVKESAEMEAEAHAHIELWGKALREKAAVEARAERLEAALQFYSCKDGCNDCSENERDLIGCGWTARVALKGADHV